MNVTTRLGIRTYLRVPELTIVSQATIRREIPDAFCRELRCAGFKSAKVNKSPPFALNCVVQRLEEILCVAKRMLPHYISEETRKRMSEYIRQIESRKKLGRHRIPFVCPK